jgi:Xaa-Pro aminopeptidase
LVLDHIRKSGLKLRRIGIEFAFMPTDMEHSLTSTSANLEYREALPALERLRARKSPAELRLLREASERVVDAMLAVIAGHGPGITATGCEGFGDGGRAGTVAEHALDPGRTRRPEPV